MLIVFVPSPLVANHKEDCTMTDHQVCNMEEICQKLAIYNGFFEVDHL
jgi:hypothetical protein